MPDYVSWKTPWSLKVYRVSKFKQRRAILGSSTISGMPGVAKGACVGFVFAWLRRRLQQPAELPTERAEYLYSEDSLLKVEVDCNSFNNAYSLLGTNVIGRIAEAALNICGMTRESSQSAEGLEGLDVLANYIESTAPGYYFFDIQFAGVDIAHACAIHASDNGFVFFDPNSGEYRIRLEEKKSLLKKLHDHYLDFVSANGVKQELRFEKLMLVKLG